MSFKSRHIEENLFPSMYILQVQFKNDSELTEYFRKVGWKGLIKEQIALTGQTKFNEISVFAAFLKCNLEEKKAARYLGYKCSKLGQSDGLKQRLVRSSHVHIYSLLKCLIDSGMMPKDCTPIFVNRLNVYGKNIRKGKIALEFRHLIAQGAMKEFKGKKKAAVSLGITLKILNENL